MTPQPLEPFRIRSSESYAGQRMAQGEPPAYEHTIEPTVFFMGHALCLIAALLNLWILFQGELNLHRMVFAICIWTILGYCVYKAILGVRHGSVLRVFNGYVELGSLCEPQIVPSSEILCYRDLHPGSYLRRKIYLILRSGNKIRLPRVEDPGTLIRCLQEHMGIRPDTTL